MASTKIVGGGTAQPGIEQIVDPTAQAARQSLRYLEYAGLVNGGVVLGHYRLAMKSTTGIVTAAAASPLASLRWTDATRLAVMERVSAGVMISAGTTLGSLFDLSLFKFTGSTGNASGGVAATIGSGGKNRTSMGNSLMGDVRVASTTTIAAAAGKTNDANPIGIVPIYVAPMAGTTVVGAASDLVDLYTLYAPGHQHPVVLAANEGLEMQNPTALANGDTVLYYVVMEWAEVLAY